MNPASANNEPTSPATRPSRWWRQDGRGALVLRLALVSAIAGGAVWWFFAAPARVVHHTVTTGTVSADVLGTGTLEARTSAVVGPKIGGLIVNIVVDQGDRVKAGALLFELEDDDLRQQLGIADAEVAAAAATLDRLRSARRKAGAVLRQATANHGRVEILVANKTLSQQELDKAVEALSIATEDAATADAAILEGERRLNAAERSLAYQRARLRDTRIEAPFDALVVRRDRHPGDVVTAGSSVLQLVSTAQMWITAWVDETALTRLAEGQPARVVFRAEPDIAYAGVVARVGRETDRETRELIVDVRVAKLPATWAVGQRAEVYIEVARRADVTMLPADLVLERDGVPGVMVDVDGKAEWRDVSLGLRGRDSVEITNGLRAGDSVVRAAGANAKPLRDGRKIRSE